MTAKLIVQSIWSHGNERVQGGNGRSLAWDEEVLEKIRNSWLTFAKQLSLLCSISIPRHLFGLNDEVGRIELHGYCDASLMGYGGVIYVRSISRGRVCVRLLCSKRRVTPLQKHKTTLPKLELCGAVNHVRLRCDSEITLHWLALPPSLESFNREQNPKNTRFDEKWHLGLYFYKGKSSRRSVSRIEPNSI